MKNPQQTLLAERLALASQLHGLHDDVIVGEEYAAAFLDVEPGTLNVWRSTGRYNIPYTKVGRSVRYRLRDLRDWLQSRTHGRPEVPR
ncbi:helix-turn-helix domain-containing protein [Methylolobus aquaticus]